MSDETMVREIEELSALLIQQTDGCGELTLGCDETARVLVEAGWRKSSPSGGSGMDKTLDALQRYTPVVTRKRLMPDGVWEVGSNWPAMKKAEAGEWVNLEDVRAALSSVGSGGAPQPTVLDLVDAILPMEALLMDAPSQKYIAPEIWKAMQETCAKVRDAARSSLPSGGQK